MKTKRNCVISLFLIWGVIMGIMLAPAEKLEAKSYTLTQTEFAANKKYYVDFCYQGKYKITKIEYKKGKITSTKNSKWKKAVNCSNSFGSYLDKPTKLWSSYSYRPYIFTSKGTVTFRFTTSKKQKFIKTISVYPKPKYIKGTCTLTGKIKRIRWGHWNNTDQKLTSYVLELSSPKNIQVTSDLYSDYGKKIIFLKQKSIQLAPLTAANEKLVKKYVGKKVKIKGELWGGGATGYYIRNTSLNIKSIRKK